MIKKILKQITYKKGTIAKDKNEIINIIKKCDEIEVKSQIIYNDNSDGIVLVVNYKSDNIIKE